MKPSKSLYLLMLLAGLAVLIGLAALAGCGSDPSERMLLVRFPGGSGTDDEVAAKLPGSALYLREGWRDVEKNGVWATGVYSEAVLHVVGRNIELILTCTVSPDMAKAGQKVGVSWNDVLVDTLVFDGGWQPATATLAVPSPAGGDGCGRLGLHPVLQAPEGQGTVYVTHLSVSAELNRAARRRLADLRGEHRATAAVAEAPAGRRSAPSVTPARPDVLVFLLDAARPDHFGCYDYQRDTTPFIDTLAENGVQFSDVVTSAPYTLCSVPALLAGVEWPIHGVVQSGDVLPGELPTLAEMLADAGYFAAGYSENPYVSTATGLDRGFAAFHETWRDDRATRDLVIEDLTHLPAQKPVFCFVHFMPPHEPYLPGPEHDKFTDPSYGGSAGGVPNYLKEIDLGRRDWNEADRAHLVGLYDGNLHRVDSWVRDIVTAWRQARADREILIVVLSDHGEAFGEHRRFGHNSTLYSEMLRVPLIIHPHRMAEELAAERDQLRSLADVTPILLRLLEVPLPAGSIWPERFLTMYDGGAEPRSFVPLRTAGRPLYGLRTPERLAIYDSLTRQWLFAPDTEAAEANLRLTESATFVGMVGTLDRLLAHAAANRAAVPRAAFDEAARKRLKTLGY